MCGPAGLHLAPGLAHQSPYLWTYPDDAGGAAAVKLRKFFAAALSLALILGVLAGCSKPADQPETQAPAAAESGADTAAPAPEFPTKPITLVVPFPAGGISDILARAYADAAQGIIPQPINVMNKGGGSGTVGNYEVVKSAPDGYTWLWAATGHLSSTLHITPAQYKMEDNYIVNRVGSMAVVLVVPKDSEFKTLDDYIQYAKANPDGISAGNPGEGTVVALLQTLFQQKAGVELKDVPFSGSGTLLPAVMGGHVKSAFMNVPEVMGQVQSGELRALAVLNDTRVDVLPDVPTAEELGLKGVSGGASHYIVLPQGVPEPIVKAIDEYTKQVIATDKFKNVTAQAGYQVAYKGHDEATAEVAEWFEVTRGLYDSLGMLKK